MMLKEFISASCFVWLVNPVLTSLAITWLKGYTLENSGNTLDL